MHQNFQRDQRGLKEGIKDVELALNLDRRQEIWNQSVIQARVTSQLRLTDDLLFIIIKRQNLT